MARRTFNIHERFLRHLWSHQYVQQKALETTDGRALRVLDVGSLNTDGGPDFRDAVIRLGSVTYRGDVEFHRTVVEWLHHQHDRDQRYNRVILHVVLEREYGHTRTLVPTGRSVPVLVLEPFLSESIRSLWHKMIFDEQARAQNEIPCSGRNQSVDPDVLRGWIRRLAVERLELKLRRFDERLRELAQLRLLAVHDHRDRQGRWRVQGNPDDIPPPHRELTQANLARREFWDQLLYEGVMECLGYSKNQESFLRLARGVTLEELRSLCADNEIALQAMLLGAAGLLPKMKEVKDKESREFVRLLNGEWRTRKKLYRSIILHPGDWQFFPTRPGNFPTIRIAAASALVHRVLYDDLFRRLIETLKAEAGNAAKVRDIRHLLAIAPLPFWTHHYQFDHATKKLTRPLGIERTDEIITNAVVPLVLLYARTFKDRYAREGALQLFESMPPSVENSITRLMKKQLLKEKLGMESVSVQQGVIQLYKFYCREERCAECEVGRAVLRE